LKDLKENKKEVKDHNMTTDKEIEGETKVTDKTETKVTDKTETKVTDKTETKVTDKTETKVTEEEIKET